jgi:RNA polymerase sigma-70 factor (ECF subfamily)
MPANTSVTEREFAAAYKKYADAIFRHCYFRVFNRERGKELMQETFLRAWEYIADGHHIDNMRAFLYRVANNLIVDEARKRKEVSLEALQEVGFDPGVDETEAMQKRIDAKEVIATLKDLDKDYRDILIMRFIDGLPPAAIAEITGLTANTVSVRLHRGVKHLLSLLKRA